MMRIRPDGVLLRFDAHVMMMVVEGPVIGGMSVSSVERKRETKKKAVTRADLVTQNPQTPKRNSVPMLVAGCDDDGCPLSWRR